MLERDLNRHAQYRMAIPFRDTPAAVPSNKAVCPRCRRPRRTALSRAIGISTHLIAGLAENVDERNRIAWALGELLAQERKTDGAGLMGNDEIDVTGFFEQ